MDIELYHRTYRTFGPSPTSLLLSKVINNQLKQAASTEVDTILIEFWSRSLSPPKRSLEQLYAKYHKEREELPFVKHLKTKKELKVCVAAIWPLSDELDRDTQVLDLGLYKRTLGKLSDVYSLVCDKEPKLGNALAALQAAIAHCRQTCPNSLGDLAELYLRSGPPNQ